MILRRRSKNSAPLCFCSSARAIQLAGVFSKEELEQMVNICAKYNVLILSDEVHFLITYDGHSHTPILRLSEEARKIAIMVFSFSKGFNIMGLPQAITLIANPELQKRWDSYLIPFDFHYAVNAFSIAVVTAIASGQGYAWLQALTAYLKENRDLFLRAAAERKFPIHPLAPEAGFLFWIDCRTAGLPAEKLGEIFLERAGISLNNGLEHGEAGRGFIRLNFAVTRSNLHLALDRIEKMFFA